VLIAARDAKVKRVVYAASSSSYGDSASLPKIEENIGKPLSPYAVTKYVNELYAHVFALNYGLDIIGLRYFNVFGRRQDPNGPYAAAIPKFTLQLINNESPVIFGDGTNSRDFTYIDNIIYINHLAATTTNTLAKAQVFNAAAGERNDLNMLVLYLKNFLSKYDPEINNVPITYKEVRKGDIPHSHASVDKAKNILGYNPMFKLEKGLEIAVEWYWKNLKR
jgi:UDP-N-acetylglucosamine 4-epimerase